MEKNRYLSKMFLVLLLGASAAVRSQKSSVLSCQFIVDPSWEFLLFPSFLAAFLLTCDILANILLCMCQDQKIFYGKVSISREALLKRPSASAEMCSLIDLRFQKEMFFSVFQRLITKTNGEASTNVKWNAKWLPLRSPKDATVGASSAFGKLESGTETSPRQGSRTKKNVFSQI